MRASVALWGLLLGLGVVTGSWVLAQPGPAPMPPLPPAGTTPPSQGTTPVGNTSQPGTTTPPAPPGTANPLAPDRPVPPPPPADAVAATVNGQKISELAVYRAQIRDDRPDRDKVRKEILNFLIDNVLVDQYLTGLKIAVEKKEVDERVEQLKKEAAEQKEDFKKILEALHLTEEEFRYQLTCQVRWDKFVAQQATDKALKEFFDKNRTMFDGSQVRARHILIIPGGGADASGQAKTKLAGIKKQIEDDVAKELAQ